MSIHRRALDLAVFISPAVKSPALEGALLRTRGEPVRCSFHPTGEVEAAGACTKCGRGICDRCAVSIQGRLLCRCCLEGVPIDSSRAHAEERNLKLKDPASAAAMSMLHGGLGQLYNGEIAKGLGLIVAKVVVLLSGIFMCIYGAWYLAVPTLFLGWGGLWIFGVWDAYSSATRHNREQFSFGPSSAQWSKGHF
jgi:hypothetical protein